MDDFQNRIDIYEILELASKFSEDGYGNYNYVFEASIATVVLDYCIYDGDVSVKVIVQGQNEPILKIDLLGCKKIDVINEKRMKCLDFTGIFRVENDFSRRQQPNNTGFRLQIEPFLTVEVFCRAVY